jgi:hypothetical protein
LERFELLPLIGFHANPRMQRKPRVLRHASASGHREAAIRSPARTTPIRAHRETRFRRHVERDEQAEMIQSWPNERNRQRAAGPSPESMASP